MPGGTVRGLLGTRYIDMDWENFSMRRWEQRRRGESDHQVYKPTPEDFFCWRWCRKQFTSDLKDILQSILSNGDFYRFRIEYLHFTNTQITGRPLAHQILEVYGDDPVYLVQMWDWAKSSGAFKREEMNLEFSPKYPPSMEGFYRRLRQDEKNNSGLPLHFAPGLSDFLTEQYYLTLDRVIKHRLQVLRLGGPHIYDISFLETIGSPGSNTNTGDFSIAFGVAGSGKTQHLFNHLYRNWGHYLVSGRLPSIDISPDSFLTARRGLASQDTSYLCEISSQDQNFETYGQGLVILIDNRRRTLRHAHSLLLDMDPRDWLLFQTVCTRGFDPFLETFKIAIICQWADRSEPFPLTETVCFDEVQCEINPERTSPDERQPLDAFLDMCLSMLRDAENKLILSGTSLQLTGCLRRFQGLNLATYDRSSSSRTFQVVMVEPDIFNRFDLVSTSDDFHKYMHSHVKRLIEQARYLTTLEDNMVIKYKLWEVFIPYNQSLSKELLYQRLSLILRVAGNDAVEEVFLWIIGCCAKPFRYTSTQPLSSLFEQFSAIFRGRPRWNILFIETTFVELLRRMGIILEHLAKGEKITLNDIHIDHIWHGANYLKYRSKTILKDKIKGRAYYLSRSNSPESLSTEQDEDAASDRDFPTSQTAASELAKELSDSDESMLDFDELIPKRDELTESDLKWISEESKHCQDVIKSALRRRLEKLEKGHKPEHIYMLEDLYWTALRADLMHKPCILRDTTSGQLITEGFAQMDNSCEAPNGSRVLVRQKLAEPLAVAAIIEHLRAQGGDRHKDMLKRLLFDNQDDASSFGKTAEYYLACSIGGLLQCGDIHHLAPESRKVFIDILNNAEVVTRSRDRRQQANLIHYSLHISAPGAPKNGELGQPLEFHRWLQHIREKKFFPTFYFPSTLAGPDIVFAMKHNDPALKTGESCQKKDAAKVLSTIDPNLWFSSKPTKNMRRALEDEIKMWKDPLEFVTVLFTTSVSIKKFFAFKDYSVLPPSKSTVGNRILEVALQMIAKAGKKSLSEEDGQSISTRDDSVPDVDNLSLREDSSRENADRQQDVDPGINFRFAVLEQRHTAHFFGKSVDELIGLIKDLKRDLPEDKGEALDEEEFEELRAAARDLRAPELRYCAKTCEIRGYSRLKKKELVEKVVQEATRLGVKEVLDVVGEAAGTQPTKRGAAEDISTRDTKKHRL